MYNNFKIKILLSCLITYLMFTEYWCLLYYAYIPYGNIELNSNKICNITGSEMIYYTAGKYITALNISVVGEPILGRAYIADDMGSNILGRFQGKYVYERNDLFNNMPAWFCNAACNDYNFDMKCFQDNYICDENNSCECYVGTELSNGMYPVILKQKCDNCNQNANFAPHSDTMGIEVFFPVSLIVTFGFVVLEIFFNEHTDYETKEFTKFESKGFCLMRELLHFLTFFLVGIYVLGKRLSVEMFSGDLKIELFGILFFVCFPYGVSEFFRNLRLLGKVFSDTSPWKLSDLIFPGNHKASKIEFNVRMFTYTITVYIPIICLMISLWCKYGIDNTEEIMAFVLLILQVLIQVLRDLCILWLEYILKERELENSLNSNYATDEKVYISE